MLAENTRALCLAPFFTLGEGCSSSRARFQLSVQSSWHLVLCLHCLPQNLSHKEPTTQLPTLVLCLGSSSRSLRRAAHLKSN